jgi:hypothetical protein
MLLLIFFSDLIYDCIDIRFFFGLSALSIPISTEYWLLVLKEDKTSTFIFCGVILKIKNEDTLYYIIETTIDQYKVCNIKN